MEHDSSISESSPHIANIGRMVEDMENKIRNTLNEIYFGKTKDIVNGLCNYYAHYRIIKYVYFGDCDSSNSLVYTEKLE